MLPLMMACAETADLEAPVEPPAEAAPAHYSFDLGAEVQRFAQTRPEATDGEFKVYASATASVHMHVIAPGQMCPLHIHRSTHEATVIVGGAPGVTHVWGMEGELARMDSRPEVGELVLSRPFAGHAWHNDTDAHQANLVIASPPFDGNLYLYASDERMLPGPPPGFFTEAGEVPFPLPLVREVVDAPTDLRGGDTLIYVIEGAGRVHDVELRPGVAVVLKEPATVEPEGPLELYRVEL